jgi:hypothetical protein
MMALSALFAVGCLVSGFSKESAIDFDASPPKDLVEHESSTGDGASDAADASQPTPDADAALDTRLVGDWPFDEGSGTAVSDVSGRGHHGVVQGGTWTADRFGVAGKAFLIAGSREYVSVGKAPDFGRPAGATLTITAWARVDATPAPAFIVEVDFADGGQFGLDLENGTTVGYFDGVAHVAQATVPDVVGAWHHFGVVVDGQQVRTYLDGVRVKAGIAASSTPIADGYLLFGGRNTLRGAIDQIRFYRVALTDAEILADKDR